MSTKTDNYKELQPPIEQKSRGVFEKLTCALTCVILFLFSGSWYHDSLSRATEPMDKYPFLWYDLFMDLNTFALVGFGFSMTYLRRYAFTSLSMTLLILAISIPLGLTSPDIISFVFEIHNDDGLITGHQLSQGLYASITVLITFGVLLGRINPSQLICISFIEIMFWTINMHINNCIWGLHDVGFAINIHTFATYFGLAISWMIEPALDHTDKKSMYNADMFSMIGTLFLWLYWPSFNAYNADPDYYFHDRAIVNTVLSLCGSTFAAFFMSLVLSTTHRFDITHIQNCTLSGGVAIGAVADLYIHPVGAISIGIVSGIISVLGFVYVSNAMEDKLKIADTRGVHNVYGMPAILSACTAAIVLAASSIHGDVYVAASHPGYPFFWPQLHTQAQYTIVALCTTLLMAIFGGAVTGWILVLFKFPNYEFRDSDNFNVFFGYQGADPFRDTIRGVYFGSKQASIKGPISHNESLLDGDFDWTDGLEEDEHPQNIGIQVVDTLRMTHGMNVDIGDWRRYIELDMMPSAKSISYANIFRDYYFDDEEDNVHDAGVEVEEDEMFYPAFSTAKVLRQSFDESKDREEEYEYYMTAKLKSNVDPSCFKRQHLNLVIVLDIAGAISADFEYGSGDNTEGNKNMEIANMIAGMLNDHLTNMDRFGVVALSGKVRVLQSLKFVNAINIEQLKRDIVFLRDSEMDSNIGSYDAFEKGMELFQNEGIEYNEAYENRVIFMTVGITGDDGRDFIGEQFANDENLRVYTTIIGIGIGFTSELERRSRFRGLNFVNVQKTVELKGYFEDVDKFTFLVTPIFYNINLKLNCLQDSCHIEQIYGSKNKKYTKQVMKRGNILKIHTLFASNESIEIVQSGILLIKLKTLNENKNINVTITVSYEDRSESEYVNEKSITFKKEAYCDSDSIRKSILLCQYTEILINWIQDAHKNRNDNLEVSKKYKQIFTHFAEYFEEEMTKCNDKTLQKELDVLHKLAEH